MNNNYFYETSMKIYNNIINQKFPINNTQEINNNTQEINNNAQEINNCLSPLITSTLLLCENLLKKDRIYNYSNEESELTIKDIITNKEFKKNFCLLNEKGEVSNYLDYYYNEDNYVINDDDLNKEIVISPNQSDDIDTYTINYKKLITIIRNSIAHSEYEIQDMNTIRIYKYETKEDEIADKESKGEKLVLNIKIDIILVLFIINELNEVIYRFIEDDLNLETYNNRTRYNNRDETINYLNSFNIFNESLCEEIANEAMNTFKEKYNKELEDIEYYSKEETDYFNIIKNILVGKVEEINNISAVLNEVIEKNAYIYYDILYNYFPHYEYKSFSVESSFYKKDNINKTILKIYLITFLNLILLNPFNEYKNHKQNINFNNIDFSKFKLDNYTIEKYIKKINNKKNDTINRLRSKENKFTGLEESIKNNINDYNKFVEKHGKENEYMKKLKKEIIPQKNKQLEELQMEYYRTEAQEIIETLDNNKNSFSKNDIKTGYISKFIIENIRNSLAHGNYILPKEIDLNNFYNQEISFIDIDPSDRKTIEFRGKIKIGELLEILTSNNYLKEVFKLDNKKTKIKQKLKY